MLAVVAAALAAAGAGGGFVGRGHIRSPAWSGPASASSAATSAARRTQRAAGLDPCTLSDRRRGAGGALTVLSIRLGKGDDTLVATRSDGTVPVIRAEARRDRGASGGIGFEAGPLKVGADGRIGNTFSRATGWEFPDAAAAKRFLTAFDAFADARRFPPAWRSLKAPGP